MLFRLVAAGLVLSGAPLSGAEVDVDAVSVDKGRMIAYLAREGQRLGEEADRRISTRAKVDSERERLRREFRFMIGLEPLPPRTPLHVTHVRTVERDEYTVEVLHFQSMPKFYVTANIYKPKNANGRLPAVIWGPGHSPYFAGAKALRQNYAIPWVRAGYLCMVIDPIQVAETFAVHRGTAAWRMWDWYARGYSPIGVEVWNAMRAVDYLATRPDVDATKLTVNGVSGGGHLSWMLGAADERIAVVQPVAGTADVPTHVADNLQRMHCDCAYFINTYRHDWPTLAALMAPRPLLLHCSTEDAYYPRAGYHAVTRRTARIYELFGAADKTGLFEVPGRHAYTQAQREKAVEWSDRWLLDKESTVRERPFEEIPGEQLAAFGADLPTDDVNRRIHEIFIPVAEEVPIRSQAEWKSRRAEVLGQLESVTFRNLPRPFVAAGAPPEGTRRFALETEPGILVGMSNDRVTKDAKRPALLCIASPGDTLDSVARFARAYPWRSSVRSLNIVWPRGFGATSWDSTTEWRFRRTAMLLGRTLDDMRLFDVLCALEQVTTRPDFDGTNLTVVGSGVEGILGAYAALFDPRVTRVVLRSPPSSHKTGPIFLNVLRYTDIPQTLALLAPRELVFLTDEGDRFAYARDIYKLYGMEKNFRQGSTVTQVLNQPNK